MIWSSAMNTVRLAPLASWPRPYQTGSPSGASSTHWWT